MERRITRTNTGGSRASKKPREQATNAEEDGCSDRGLRDVGYEASEESGAPRQPMAQSQSQNYREDGRDGSGSYSDPDAPEIEEFMVRERGKFYRPVKQQITLRLDKDVVAWFKASGDKYQTRINEALREYIRLQAQRG